MGHSLPRLANASCDKALACKVTFALCRCHRAFCEIFRPSLPIVTFQFEIHIVIHDFADMRRERNSAMTSAWRIFISSLRAFSFRARAGLVSLAAATFARCQA